MDDFSQEVAMVGRGMEEKGQQMDGKDGSGINWHKESRGGWWRDEQVYIDVGK